MTLIEIASPLTWNSLHRDIIYKYKYPYTTISFSEYGTTGDTLLTYLLPSVVVTIKIGDSVYVPSGIYAGTHSIKKVISNTQLVIDFAYISDVINLPYCEVLYRPSMLLVTGLITTLRPVKIIDTIKPSYNIYDERRITLNVSEFLKKDFPIMPPTIGDDQNLYNQFWIIRDGIGFAITKYNVYNSTVESSVLNDKINSGKPLNDMTIIRFNCGTIIQTFEDGGKIIVGNINGSTLQNQNYLEYENGVPFQLENAEKLELG